MRSTFTNSFLFAKLEENVVTSRSIFFSLVEWSENRRQSRQHIENRLLEAELLFWYSLFCSHTAHAGSLSHSAYVINC